MSPLLELGNLVLDWTFLNELIVRVATAHTWAGYLFNAKLFSRVERYVGHRIFWNHRFNVVFPDCTAVAIAMRGPVAVPLSVIHGRNASLTERPYDVRD